MAGHEGNARDRSHQREKVGMAGYSRHHDVALARSRSHAGDSFEDWAQDGVRMHRCARRSC